MNTPQNNGRPMPPQARPSTMETDFKRGMAMAAGAAVVAGGLAFVCSGFNPAVAIAVATKVGAAAGVGGAAGGGSAS